MDRGQSEWCLFVLLCLVSLANATPTEVPKNMGRVRWLLLFSPLFVLGVTLVILGLGKLWKRRDSKDKKAGIDLDDIEQGKPKSLRDQRDSKVKTHPENVPEPSELRIPLLSHKNHESERSSSTGPEDNSLSAATSRNTSNIKSSVQSGSVKSGATEPDKRTQSKSTNHKTAKNVPGPSELGIPLPGQKNQESKGSSSTGPEDNPLSGSVKSGASRQDNRAPSKSTNHKTAKNIPGPSALETQLPGQMNQESERSSSTGTEDNSLSAASSRNTSNIKSSVQSGSVNSGASEPDKRTPSKSMNHETAKNVPEPSELGIPLPGQKNQESKGSSSTRPEDNPLSGSVKSGASERDNRAPSKSMDRETDTARSHNMRNRESSVQSESVQSGASEQDKTAPSTSTNQETDSNTSRASGQRNRTQSDRSSEKSPRRSRSSSGNRQTARSDQPPEKKSRTDGDKQDSTKLSHKLDTNIKKRPPEDKGSSHDTTRWEKENEIVSASNVPDDFPGKVYQQQYDTTTGVTRPDSRGGSDKSSQKDHDEQPPEKQTRPNGDKEDSTLWPSEDKIYDLIKKTFLEKLKALDVTARHICSPGGDTNTYFDFDKEESDAFMDSEAYNPLDVVCDVLHDSDALLQQEIVSKMSMCQFSIPLLLPPGDGSHYTFMLWAMRDIVKRWRPQSLVDSSGFKEENLVEIAMPIFSFVRLGKCSISKSKLLNQVLSPPEFIHNYFVHGDMPCGNAQRKRSDGLVEMSCYFPAGHGHSDIFPDPVTVINLRGDLECHWKRLESLASMSLAVFVFIESINEEQYSLLSKVVGKNPQFFFIVNLRGGDSDVVILEYLKSLSTTHNLKKDKFIVKNKKVNDTQVVKTLQSKLKVLIANTAERSTLEEIAARAAELDFKTDENFVEAKKATKAITSEINNVLDYKKETMKLQGDLWKQLAKCEKELCRMRKLEDRDVEEYRSELQGEIARLRKQQSKQELAYGVKQFLEALNTFSTTKRKVFLKWLKIQLDKLGRHQLALLNNEYRKLLTDGTSNANDLMKIDQKIADSSLGVEHFIRELGQFYEAKDSIGNQKMSNSLPKIAANLLLDGFPLELIDGDASNIPLQWMTDVLSELDGKTGRNCTIRVITVLGVQSTGKSTLLNTMFGLQFPTSSGRCTRGAFMTLLDAKKSFDMDLGCDYVMIIDTEGLKSMELASLEGSYEHDNELATVVVGLSDITIINMAMENTEEMKDILQIVIHAFLRMKEAGKKSSCQFVHQNVSDVSAHVKNRKAREKFIEQLNEMTKVSARMEKKGGITAFSDIIHCDIESNSWYIPGLWHGIPPMASVNLGYSENVQELKKSIAGYLKTMPGKPQNITQFTEWMRSLWNAVKHEKFVFSFRNRLVTEAYNQLCIEYSDWEWRFQKKSHNWMINTETQIFNLSSDQLGTETWAKIQNEMNYLLDKEELVMARSLEKYFMEDCDNAHLLEMFKGDFCQSIRYLRKNLEFVLLGKCDRTIQIQKEKCQIQALQERYIGILEERVSNIMDRKRKNQYVFDAERLKVEFETIWEEATSTLPKFKKKRNVDLEILQQLKRNMQCDDRIVIQKLDNLTSLHQYRGEEFHMNGKYLQKDSDTEWAFADSLASSVQRKCDDKVSEIANSKKDFDEIYSMELLKMIDKALHGRDTENLRTTKLFELDLKLCVLGKAAETFQKMHDDFVRSNDPRSYLEEMKPQYFSMFNNMFEKRDECERRAIQFCMVCLKPAIMDHINRHLGKEIVHDILQKDGPQEFKSRKILQREVLQRLLVIGSLDQYVEYVNNYEGFMKRWISQYLSEHYKGQDTIRSLQKDILQSLMEKIERALNDKKTIQAKTILDYLVGFCNVLKKELVIPQSSTKVVIFQSDVRTIKQFAHDIKLHLPALEKLVEEDITSPNTETIFSQLTLKPQDELFRKVMGCGKRCPFCKAPCEAVGEDHKEHFASVHRPRGLAQHVNEETNTLDHSICSSNVLSNKSFRNVDTEGKPHPYKDYQKYYPDWAIYPDTTADGSDYWKLVFKELNQSLAKRYNANPANIPQDWYKLTKDQALKSLQKTL